MAPSSHTASSVARTESGSDSTEGASARVPVLSLDRDGIIRDLNKPARRTLEYSGDDTINPCFFTHVHGRNLRRVMRDLAYMVSHRRRQAQWLVRLRTGNERWRWYRVFARNHLDHSDGRIELRLRPL